jgi:2-polyprenyl-6-methoxyphenol hydroxylase-like FAD-dependent oxidoreductase
MTSAPHGFSVAVVGGSLAGLAVAAELQRHTDARVTVYEQSRGPLQGRGAGIVMQPETEVLLDINGVAPATVSVPLRERRFLHRNTPPRTVPAPQAMTAWDTLYRALRGANDDLDYRQGMAVTGISTSGERVQVTLDGADSVYVDAVIGADGIGSATRNAVYAAHPIYTGYMAWRGLENESDLPDELVAELNDRFTLFSVVGTQFLCYLVPGPRGQTTPGQRRVNWVWYINTPEPLFNTIMTGGSGRRYEHFLPSNDVNPAVRASLRTRSQELLPELLARLVASSRPFVQPVMDVAPRRMRRGPIFLIGDAAGTVRPHTASGTSKSFADALTLVAALGKWTPQVPLPEERLDRWELFQLDHLRQIAVSGLAGADASGLGKGRVDTWTRRNDSD